MSDIFISYSRNDRARVSELANCLEARGWDVWWDPEIPVGQSYRKVISKALDETRCVVVVWSKSSIESDWVLAEAGAGKDRNILVPISIDGTKPQLDFGQIQTADFSSWTGNDTALEFRQVTKGIAGVIGTPTEDPNHTPESRPPRKTLPNQMLITGAGLLAAVAAGYVWLGQKPEPLPKSITYGEREMMLVPKGPFQMGANLKQGGQSESQPERTVYLDAFYMDKLEVSNAEFRLFQDSHPGHELIGHHKECASRPETAVCGVRWSSAKAFCAWRGKDLPTEAQWEKAARGINGRDYPWGDETPTEMSLHANFRYGGDGEAFDILAHPKGQSLYGIYNLSGNVSEWVVDWYSPIFYETAPEQNPVNQNAENSPGRGIRGGSFSDRPENLKAFTRSWERPEQPRAFVGFRCVTAADNLS